MDFTEAEKEIIRRRNRVIARALFGLVFMVVGYATLAFIDWRITVAVFLVQWASNINNNLTK